MQSGLIRRSDLNSGVSGIVNYLCMTSVAIFVLGPVVVFFHSVFTHNAGDVVNYYRPTCFEAKSKIFFTSKFKSKIYV